MNVCKQCVFYRRGFFDWLKRNRAKCAHSANVDIITGRPYITCYDNRNLTSGNNCGHMGKFYEPKVVIKPVIGEVPEVANYK